MKGKLVYTAVVEKEIEIPDEVIDALDKVATSWDPDAYALMDEFSTKAWQSVDNVETACLLSLNKTANGGLLKNTKD